MRTKYTATVAGRLSLVSVLCSIALQQLQFSTVFGFSPLSSLFRPSTTVDKNPSASTTITAPRHENAESLAQYLEEGASRLNENLSIVRLSQDECGIRYQPIKDTQRQEKEEGKEIELAHIHRDEFISPLHGKNTPVGQALESYLEQHLDDYGICFDFLPSMYVAIFLCDYAAHSQACKSYGTYEPYLKTLPTIDNMQHLPIFWSQKSMEELHGSGVYSAIQRRRRAWKQEYNIIRTAIQKGFETTTDQVHKDGKGNNIDNNHPFVDFNTWCWARSIITSRAFEDNKTKRPQGEEICLVPYIDMLNHRSSSSKQTPSNSKDNVVHCLWELTAEGFSLTKLPRASIKEEIDKQAQERDDEGQDWKGTNHCCQINEVSSVEISYGSHGNAVMMMNYGFSVLNDDHQTKLDNAEVAFTLPEDLMIDKSGQTGDKHEADDARKYLEELWEMDGYGRCYEQERTVLLEIGNPGPVKTLLSFCRVTSSQSKTELLEIFREFMKRRERRGQNLGNDDDDNVIPAMAGTLSRVPFSLENEICAMVMLKNIIAQQLSRYKTTLADDELLLLEKEKHGPPSRKKKILVNPVSFLISKSQRTTNEDLKETNRYNAIVLRRSEKRVLQHFYNLAELCLYVLTRDDTDFDEYPENLLYYLENDKPILRPSLI